VVTCHYCNKFGIPYVLTTHGSSPWLNDNAMLNKLYRILFGKRILFNASKIFVLNSSEFSLCKHMGIPEDKLQVIPNGINLSDYQNLPNNGKFRLKHSINTDVPIILYVGRIYKKKGLDLLVQAFSLVLKDIPEARLVLIGPDDGYQHYLIELSETLQIYDKLIFCGFLSHNDKMEAFVDSDVFVTPKFYGFPITFIEACICGKPIVTTNEGDWLDWIHRHTGCCIDYNIQSLKQAIIFIIKNDKISKEFGENGKKIVNNYFNWEKIVKKVEIVYTKIKR
jgi:glycosyltransferase involved in cell wall biosynthesis